jgi:hypothetical protein
VSASSAQLPFYSHASATATLPPELLLAVEQLTGIPTAAPLKLMPTVTPSENLVAPPLLEASIAPEAKTDVVAPPKLTPPRRRTTKKKVSFSSSRVVTPSRMAMRLVNEPTIEGFWPDQLPLALPAWQQRTQQQGKPRLQWLQSAVVVSLLATRSFVNAFAQSEPWVYKALQTGVVGILCLNVLAGCINIGHQLTMAMVQRPYAEQLALETQVRHSEIEQSLVSLKKGEGVEVLARGYMDMVEPNQVLVKVR